MIKKLRIEGDFIKLNEWLTPLSWIYGAAVTLRNWLFDIGVKKAEASVFLSSQSAILP